MCAQPNLINAIFLGWCAEGYWPLSSVTRSGDLLDFGQLLNAFGNT